MKVSPVNTCTRVRVALATICLLVSGAPSLAISGADTVLAAAASETIAIHNTQAELVGAWTPVGLQGQLLRDRLPVSPGRLGSEPYPVAAHACSRRDLRR